MIAIGGTGSGSAGAAVRCCMRDGSHSARRDSSQQTMKYTAMATTSVCRMLKYIEPRRRGLLQIGVHDDRSERGILDLTIA